MNSLSNPFFCIFVLILESIKNVDVNQKLETFFSIMHKQNAPILSYIYFVRLSVVCILICSRLLLHSLFFSLLPYSVGRSSTPWRTATTTTTGTRGRSGSEKNRCDEWSTGVSSIRISFLRCCFLTNTVYHA